MPVEAVLPQLVLPTATRSQGTSQPGAGPQKHQGSGDRLRKLEGLAQDVLRVLGGCIEHTVVHSPAVRLRVAPSTAARAVGRLLCGAVVRGVPAGGWLRLDQEEVSRSCEGTPLCAGPAWVLINGTHLGKGDLLVPNWAQLSVTATYWEALDLTWPGIAAELVNYCVQWRSSAPRLTEDEDAVAPGLGAERTGGHAVCSDTSLLLLLHGLPAASRLQVRVVARVCSPVNGIGDIGLVGAWTDLFTATPSGVVLGHSVSVALMKDPFSDVRGCCPQAGCRASVPADSRDSAPWDRCRQSACSFGHHVRIDGVMKQATAVECGLSVRARDEAAALRVIVPRKFCEPAANVGLEAEQALGSVATSALPLRQRPGCSGGSSSQRQKELQPLEQDELEATGLEQLSASRRTPVCAAQASDGGKVRASSASPSAVLQQSVRNDRLRVCRSAELAPEPTARDDGAAFEEARSSISSEDLAEDSPSCGTAASGRRSTCTAADDNLSASQWEDEEERARWEVLLAAELLDPDASEATSEISSSDLAEGWSRAEASQYHGWLEVIGGA